MALQEFIHRSLDQHYECMARSVADLTHQELVWNPDEKSMSIGFLVWHYARTLDRWIHSRVLDVPQLWERGWADQFGRLPPDPSDTGYGFTVQQVQSFQAPSASVLLDYALAAKDIDSMMSVFADDFSFAGGDKAAIATNLQASAEQGFLDGIDIDLGGVVINVDGTKASAGPVVLERAFGTMSLSFDLEKRDGVWLVTSQKQE